MGILEYSKESKICGSARISRPCSFGSHIYAGKYKE